MGVHRIHIPEQVVAGRRLGRHIVIDDRSVNFAAELAPAIVSVTHRSAGLPLDQGESSSCTGRALAGNLNTLPHWEPGQPTLGELDAAAVYSDEEIALGFGPFPPNDNGGSGLDVCAAAKKRGWIIAYQHPTGIDQALRALVPRSVITGVNWFTSFDHPSSSGLIAIDPGATVRGGHEFVVIGIDAVNRLVWCVNSWGSGWGVAYGGIPGGCFCMTFDTWATLLLQGGDVTVPRTARGWTAHPIPTGGTA